jgi:hypothetical protein
LSLEEEKIRKIDVTRIQILEFGGAFGFLFFFSSLKKKTEWIRRNI